MAIARGYEGRRVVVTDGGFWAGLTTNRLEF